MQTSQKSCQKITLFLTVQPIKAERISLIRYIMDAKNDGETMTYCGMDRDSVEKLFSEFLTFRTVSAEKSAMPELEKCASWLQSKLESFGALVQIWKSTGAPVVFGTIPADKPEAPTLLIYNHYDVQPVDPVSEWHTDPFIGTIDNGKIYARGSSDNKGQCLFVLLAIQALKAKKKLACNIKILIEGEEESGSTTLTRLLQEKTADLKADFAMIIDVGMREPSTPAITLGMRGLVGLTVLVSGPCTDLHSGVYGGIIENPLHVLVTLLHSLRNKDGSIAIPGFYDNVIMPTEQEAHILNLSDNELAFTEVTGRPFSGGEKAFPPTVRNWLRPTLEINGIHGGYGGEGTKTVIPKEAFAKITCRLVPNQDPHHISLLIKNFILSQTPLGTSVNVTIHEGMGKAIRTSPYTTGVQALEKAMETVFGRKPEYILDGASIPIAPLLQKASQGRLLAWGVGLPQDRIHAPNEHFDFIRLEKGFDTLCRTIAILGTLE